MQDSRFKELPEGNWLVFTLGLIKSNQDSKNCVNPRWKANQFPSGINPVLWILNLAHHTTNIPLGKTSGQVTYSNSTASSLISKLNYFKYIQQSSNVSPTYKMPCLLTSLEALPTSFSKLIQNQNAGINKITKNLKVSTPGLNFKARDPCQYPDNTSRYRFHMLMSINGLQPQLSRHMLIHFLWYHNLTTKYISLISFKSKKLGGFNFRWQMFSMILQHYLIPIWV